MLSYRTSCISASLKPLSPNLLALYAARSATPDSPATEAMLRMRPPPVRRRWGRAAFTVWKAPVRFTPSTRFHSVASISSKRAKRPIPATFTSTSIPPKRATELRTTHFPKLETPALFVSGTRDGFGTIGEMTEALKLIPARTQLVPIAGAGHELMGKRNAGELPRMVRAAFAEMFPGG